MTLYSLIKKKIMLHYNPVKYWKNCGVKIGKGAEIYSTVSFGSEPYLIEIGDNVRINEGVIFDTHDGGIWVIRHLYEEYQYADLFGPIKIGNNVHIGHNSIIMPNVTVGDNVIIGCCSIVTKNIPSNSVAVGSPARVIEDIDEYIKKHKEQYVYTKQLSSIEKKKFLLQSWGINK